VEVGHAAQVIAPRVAPIYFYRLFYKVDPPQADLKYSIFNRKYSIILKQAK